MNIDSACDYEEKTLIHELTQGLQMAEQLRLHLHSPETRDFLIRKILSSYDNALFVLKSGHSAGQSPPSAHPAPRLPESPMSFGSPGSKPLEFNQPFLGHRGENTISRKRKGSPTWEDDVRICDDNGIEGDMTDDGYHWRKYGQKDIFGAKFPRSYYRCSYRKVQKCFATKQVQRTGAGMFEIAYKGKHTCNHAAQLASPLTPLSPEKHEITPKHHHHNQQLLQPGPNEMLSNRKADLTVNTMDLGGGSDTIPSSFSFPSTSSGLLEDYNQVQYPIFDDELFQAYSTPFISPVSSESSIFTEWGSSQSLDLLADPVDATYDFEFSSLF